MSTVNEQMCHPVVNPRLTDGHVPVPGLECLVGDDAGVLRAPPPRLRVAVEVAGGKVDQGGHLMVLK